MAWLPIEDSGLIYDVRTRLGWGDAWIDGSTISHYSDGWVMMVMAPATQEEPDPTPLTTTLHVRLTSEWWDGDGADAADTMHIRAGLVDDFDDILQAGPMIVNGDVTGSVWTPNVLYLKIDPSDDMDRVAVVGLVENPYNPDTRRSDGEWFVEVWVPDEDGLDPLIGDTISSYEFTLRVTDTAGAELDIPQTVNVVNFVAPPTTLPPTGTVPEFMAPVVWETYEATGINLVGTRSTSCSDAQDSRIYFVDLVALQRLPRTYEAYGCGLPVGVDAHSIEPLSPWVGFSQNGYLHEWDGSQYQSLPFYNVSRSTIRGLIPGLNHGDAILAVIQITYADQWGYEVLPPVRRVGVFEFKDYS